jgi:hypothetical protein
MSIFHHTFRVGSNAADVSHFPRLAAGRRAAAVAAPDSGAERWRHLRRSTPLGTALPQTASWVAGLPEHLRPYALVELYPRIANRLAAAARHSGGLADCITELLIDRRGGRRGFPAEVSAELLLLRHADF